MGIVTSLGRQALTPLHGSAHVSLWAADTGQRLAFAVVGPTSAVEGGYAFGLLKNEVALTAGKEYRISQACSAGMADQWFDGSIPPEELFTWSASLYVEFLGGVFREGPGFPNQYDDDARVPTRCRRAGMLNFKMLGEDPAAEAEKYGLKSTIVPWTMLYIHLGLSYG